MKKQNIRTLSLIVVTFTYLLVGAAIFDFLESATEYKSADRLKEIERTWRSRYKMDDEDFKLLETIVLEGIPHRAGQQWEFTGAFYYATTVLTTIGYGHSTPKTLQGRMATIVYAVIGIPLCLILFHSIGERLNKVSSLVVRRIKRLLKCSNKDATEVDLILVVTTLSTITITSGAAVFSSYEKWTYFDSVYYCVITLTTIGFGDMVALQKNEALEKQPEYVAFSLIFILFGMAIVAASLNLFVLRFVTMNTEDERRDEAEALQAAAGAVRLEGDVITANGSILSGQYGRTPNERGLDEGGPAISMTELASVCSCTCVTCNPYSAKASIFSRNRYSVKQDTCYLPSGRFESNFHKSDMANRTITQEEICSSMSDYDGSSIDSSQIYHRNSV